MAERHRHHTALVAIRLAAVVQNVHHAIDRRVHAHIPGLLALGSDVLFHQGAGAQLDNRQGRFDFMHQHRNEKLLQKKDAALFLQFLYIGLPPAVFHRLRPSLAPKQCQHQAQGDQGQVNYAQ